MKKLPCPTVRASDLGGPRVVVTFEWDWIVFQMYEDEALVLARTIYDVLEEAP